MLLCFKHLPSHCKNFSSTAAFQIQSENPWHPTAPGPLGSKRDSEERRCLVQVAGRRARGSPAELGRPWQACRARMARAAPEQPRKDALQSTGRTRQRGGLPAPHNAAGDTPAAAPWKQSHSLFPSLMEASSKAPSG